MNDVHRETLQLGRGWYDPGHDGRSQPEASVKIYLAARYSRNPEMRQVRDLLEAAGHEVTSRWIDNHGGTLEESFTPEFMAQNAEFCAPFAQADVEDLLAAEMVISFTGGGGKGGRHVEFGMAAAAGKRLVIIGPRENVFHCLPGVSVVSDIDALMGFLAWNPAPPPNCPLQTGLRPCQCDLPRCPVCNYTEHDAAFELDHASCLGRIPDEVGSGVVRAAP